MDNIEKKIKNNCTIKNARIVALILTYRIFLRRYCFEQLKKITYFQANISHIHITRTTIIICILFTYVCMYVHIHVRRVPDSADER